MPHHSWRRLLVATVNLFGTAWSLTAAPAQVLNGFVSFVLWPSDVAGWFWLAPVLPLASLPCGERVSRSQQRGEQQQPRCSVSGSFGLRPGQLRAVRVSMYSRVGSHWVALPAPQAAQFV